MTRTSRFVALLALMLALAAPLRAGSLDWVNESAREIPVAYEVDVLVVGGGTGAVSAAIEAARSHARVFLAAPYPYLGDDMTATLRLWLEPGEVPRSELAKRLFDDPEWKPAEPGQPPMPRPMHVKRVLDQALVDSRVTYLFSCLPTDVLLDDQGRLCGIIMANRAGRQAVLARAIIDATPRAQVARLASVSFHPFTPGKRTFRRVVIGGQPRTAEGMTHRVIGPPFRGMLADKSSDPEAVFSVIEYSLELPLDDNSYAAWCRAEQQVRSMTYDSNEQFTSDALDEVPRDRMHSRRPSTGPWRDAASLPLDAFRALGVENLFVLGPRADVSDQQAAALSRPLVQIDLGARLGRAAAELAAARPDPVGAHVLGTPSPDPVAQRDVGEVLHSVRPMHASRSVPQEARSLPVLGQYDVLVVGGGTAGAPAAIAAARRGAKTLVVEYLHTLGGVGTAGAISKYYHGNRVGFTREVGGGDAWQIEPKAEWFRRAILDAGGEIWTGAIGCGAFVDGRRVRGTVVATPYGRGVVLAKVVIDATGNADVAAAAGAECVYTDDAELAMQGAGLPARRLGASYENTDFTLADETDMVDVWRMFVHAKDKYPDAFDQGTLLDTRERRRIVGDFTLTILDIVNRRTFPDSIVLAKSNFDTHGYTVDPYFMLEHPLRKELCAYVPYRCLLPRGWEGILVVGLGASAHRDALPIIRMQPDVQNQGYAAGVAAAMAARAGVGLRDIDVRTLQRHLVEVGNLPKEVLNHKDSHPLPPERVARAVAELPKGKSGPAAVTLAQPREALPLLRKAYAEADPADKLVYAKTLCMVGDATGVQTVIDAVASTAKWDKGWNYQGAGQFGHALSPLDTLVIALGRTRRPEVVPVLLDKARLLTPEVDFSHHRAVALALELVGDHRAAKVLAEVLRRPGMTGFAETSLERVRRLDSSREVSVAAVVERRQSLRELLLARALFRCGDHENRGRTILTQYTHDLRGHLARHATAVLDHAP
jgi:hypothetical protein